MHLLECVTAVLLNVAMPLLKLKRNHCYHGNVNIFRALKLIPLLIEPPVKYSLGHILPSQVIESV